MSSTFDKDELKLGRMPGRAFFLFGIIATFIVGVAGIAGRVFSWLDVSADFSLVALLGDALFLIVWIAKSRLRRDAIVTAILFVAFAANSALVGPEFLRASIAYVGESKPSNADLKVLTFNVWNDSADRQRTIDTILSSGADIVTLQEATGFTAFKLLGRMSATYPYHTTCDTWWGCEVIILSRFPIGRHGDVLNLDHTKCPLTFVWAEIKPEDRAALTIASTHLGRPWPPRSRACETDKLASAIKKLGRDDVILTGDFNAAGGTSAVQRQDRELLPLVRRTLLLPTWPAYLPVWRIEAPFPILALDQAYAAPVWRTVSVRLLDRSASDHYPLEITLVRGG